MSNTIKYGNSEDQIITFDTKNISIVGCNGSGKSSLMRKIKNLNSNFTIISAHKNLTIKQGRYRAEDESWLNQHRSYFNNPVAGDLYVPSDNNSVQNDFSQIVEIVFRSYMDESIEAFNADKTRKDVDRQLDKIFAVWNLIFNDKKLLYKDKRIKAQIASEDIFYDIENLSDGERVALYVLIKVSLADSQSTIIIDEPETFLNPAILNHLFDECEKIQNKSNFIYLSHDLEFVTTRKNNTIFWIKEYKHPDVWKIECIDQQEIPEELIMKVIGAKKRKILFVESEKNKDSQLYQLLYPDFKVWPVGSCENVINYTKSFNCRTEKFNKEYFGLIDRDLRTSEQIASLEDDKVFCIPVAIYENLFIYKEIISFVFKYLGRGDFEDKYKELESGVKQKILNENFKLGYKKSKIQDLFNVNIEAISKGEMQLIPEMDKYEREIESFQSKDYNAILEIYNQKDLKGCISKLGYEWYSWQNQILNIFNTDKAQDIRKEFMKLMPDIK